MHHILSLGKTILRHQTEKESWKFYTIVSCFSKPLQPSTKPSTKNTTRHKQRAQSKSEKYPHVFVMLHSVAFTSSGIILFICPANEKQLYNVMSSLIGWAHTNSLYILSSVWSHVNHFPHFQGFPSKNDIILYYLLKDIGDICWCWSPKITNCVHNFGTFLQLMACAIYWWLSARLQ